MTLITLLVVIVIIAAGVGVYLGLFNKSSGSDNEKKTTVGKALDKSHGVECANRLNQLRMQLKMDRMDLGHYPKRIDPKDSLTHCPVSGKMYKYNPKTGKVWCTTPGHEKF